jgi:integrase
LDSITRSDLKIFSLGLAEKGLVPATVNKIMSVGETALAWAYREGMIPDNPTEGLIAFTGEAKKRGVLTPLEAQALFSHAWKDERSYVGNLIACSTGLRAGEILALKREDIGERTLNVRHSWSNHDGLKCPKNGETRRVPLLPGVRGKLLVLADTSPYGAEGFIFYGMFKGKPAVPRVLLNGLQSTLIEIGINAKERGIVFHSWRHFYAARMADVMDADQVSRITGPKSRAIFDEYANHISEENLEEAGRTSAGIPESSGFSGQCRSLRGSVHAQRFNPPHLHRHRPHIITYPAIDQQRPLVKKKLPVLLIHVRKNHRFV